MLDTSAMTPPASTDIQRALTVLVGTEHPFELRAISTSGVVNYHIFQAGQITEAADWATRYSERDSTAAVYFVLNQVKPENTRAANDGSIQHRRWLLVDLDPQRPKHTSATEAEKEATRQLAERVQADLTQRGWPAPVLIDSGNGTHLLYRLDLPNNGPARELVQQVLLTLANQWNTGAVAVDLTVYNASRVSKLPGTWTRKGEHTEERPHRMSQLLSVPEVITTVTEDQLRALAEDPSIDRTRVVPKKKVAPVVAPPPETPKPIPVAPPVIPAPEEPQGFYLRTPHWSPPARPQTNPQDWKRVKPHRPCPICGRPDWCLYLGDDHAPEVVICPRVKSTRTCGDAGYLHLLTKNRRKKTLSVSSRVTNLPSPEYARFEAMVEDFQAAVFPTALDRLAASLGLQSETLRRFGVGWNQPLEAWAFPMRDAQSRAVGIHLRRLNGDKFCVQGSKLGLFLPSPLTAPVDRLLVAEGLSDTATLHELGFTAVGRASCSTGQQDLCELVRRFQVRQVCIMADGDTQGQQGADNLAARLVIHLRDGVRVITPPAGFKDVRGWYHSGAKQSEVQSLIQAAAVRRFGLTGRFNNGGKHV